MEHKSPISLEKAIKWRISSQIKHATIINCAYSTRKLFQAECASAEAFSAAVWGLFWRGWRPNLETVCVCCLGAFLLFGAWGLLAWAD
ncbi:UNVERIFIED_CONTAM: hypothetical protein Sradi_6943800 [Sesamum radiatum]|uniref:Uncharacterized protein n=1 Tax=Sesamum radiatum TaxID=300843 RepID=A0AAW2JGF4_SESRA